MNAVTGLQDRFARAVEAEYVQRELAYLAAGQDPKEAHQHAFEDTKRLGELALQELRSRGLFPWPTADSQEGASHVS